MLFSNQPFHIHGAPAHLLPVHVPDQRLVARIFLAHAASLRHTIFFARMKFGEFLHSFRLNLGLGGGFLSALSALLVRLNFLFVTIGVKFKRTFLVARWVPHPTVLRE